MEAPPNKSSFREVVSEIFTENRIIVTDCPVATPLPYELIMDFFFLFFIKYHHLIPTYAMYLWEKIIHKLGVCRGANLIRITVGKPKYLPEPRALLHDTRSSMTGKMKHCRAKPSARLQAIQSSAAWCCANLGL